MLDRNRFNEEFQRFERLIPEWNKGRAFTNFHEGVVNDWEGYKLRLRDDALRQLAPEAWTEAEIGRGRILRSTIKAVDIKGNNLVVRQNRWGRGSSEHNVLMDAKGRRELKRLERHLFDLFKGGADESATFDRLKTVLGAKYPLLAYLFFLKDMGRFMPIRPTVFDCAFRDLGIDLVTARMCSWENYQRFNDALREVQGALAAIGGLEDVRLIDAHSFCWMIEKQLKEGRERIKENREKSIIKMVQSVKKTVHNSNGQTEERIVKNKELRISERELTTLLGSLLDRQGNCCKLTRIPFHFSGPDADDNRQPSVDRIDSNGHYEVDNLQIVCKFVNFWKGDGDNEEFKRLLALVRDEGDTPPHGAVHTLPTEADIASMAKPLRSSIRSADPA